VADPSLEEVKAAVFKLKNNKAPGSDNLPGELFKYGGDALCMTLHELIVKIWEREEMPEEWELGIICPVYKKGDKLDCSNYRGINLLNTAYKIFANILYQRLLPYAEPNIGEYQGGFRNERSTTDQLFSIRQVMKGRELNVALHQLFVDF
jgi:Reverse transcriptase (RNA-dependent DNA polymerase)